MTNQRTPFVIMRNVMKRFGNFEALKNVNLTVHTGEVIVACGPSGSGKSTLIRTLNGLESHDSGDIEIDGITIDRDLRKIQKIREEVGMVFQSFNLFPHLTVLQNITLAPIWVKKTSVKDAENAARELLERVRIPEQAGKYPSQLSGGQQQRVAIARALALKPKLLLFDEPTSALDPEMVKEVLDTMKELAQSGITMICVTHEMKFAKEVADRIVFLDRGEILEIASPQEFFEHPKHIRAQTFLGQIL